MSARRFHTISEELKAAWAQGKTEVIYDLAHEYLALADEFESD